MNEDATATRYVLDACALIAAVVLSTDHHEFDPIAAKGEIRFEWLR